jgi:hypothetical protein
MADTEDIVIPVSQRTQGGIPPFCPECRGQGLQLVADPLDERYLIYINERCLRCGGTGEP